MAAQTWCRAASAAAIAFLFSLAPGELPASGAKRTDPFDYASVTEGAVARDGTIALLVSVGGVQQRLFVSHQRHSFVEIEVRDDVARMSFQQLQDVSIAEDGSFVLVNAIIAGEGEFPIRCKLDNRPDCQLLRIDRAAARQARLLRGGRTILVVPLQQEGEFKPLGVVLVDTATGKLKRVGTDVYVERILWISERAALLKVADVRGGSPSFGVARLLISTTGVTELQRESR